MLSTYDLSPADFFFTSYIKNAVKRKDIRGCLIDPRDSDGRPAFDSFCERCKLYMEAGGDYID
jgi:hypothetical protein